MRSTSIWFAAFPIVLFAQIRRCRRAKGRNGESKTAAGSGRCKFMPPGIFR